MLGLLFARVDLRDRALRRLPTSLAASYATTRSRKASSICLASAAINVLFAPSTRCAHRAASSAEPILLSSSESRSRRAAEAAASSMSGEGDTVALAARSCETVPSN